MQVQNKYSRISKMLGKVFLGILIFLVLAIALIHLPPVQKQITQKIANYLTQQMKSQVEIQKIEFSITGNVSISNLEVWAPNHQTVLVVGQLNASTSLLELLRGHLIFDEVSLTGVNAQLLQDHAGLNIQFIIDAFTPEEKPITTKSAPIELLFKNISIENTHFEFISVVNGISVVVDLGKLTSQEFSFTSEPVKIKTNQVILQKTIVNTLSTQSQSISTNTKTGSNDNLIRPDFGTGISFDIKDLQLNDNAISFHKDQVTELQKFDPDHISLKNIQISLSDILINQDSLSAVLHSLSGQLPGFSLTEARSKVKMNQYYLALSDFHMASGSSDLQADISGPYDLKAIQSGNDQIKINAHGRINPNDFAYFLSDSVLNHFRHWELSELTLKGSYAQHNGRIESVDLKTKNSQLHLEGMLNDIWNQHKLAWEEMKINVSVGADFHKTLTPFMHPLTLPSDLQFQLLSQGNLSRIEAEGNAITNWGNVNIHGVLLLLQENLGIDAILAGENVDLGKWANQSWVGSLNISAAAKGTVGKNQNVEINGTISDVAILDTPIHPITFESNIQNDSATIVVAIQDPNYRSTIHSAISFDEPVTVSNHIQLDSFQIGNLLHMDSTLAISGTTTSQLVIGHLSLEGNMESSRLLFQKQNWSYSLDTLSFHTLLSPGASTVDYLSNYGKGNLASNYDLRESPGVFQAWSKNIFKAPGMVINPKQARTLNFNFELENVGLLNLLGIDINYFSTLQVSGEFDEQKRITSVQATTGNFTGYGISLDTLNTHLNFRDDGVDFGMNVNQLLYDSITLGDLDFSILSRGDTAISNLLLMNDTITSLGLLTRLVPMDSGVLVYPEQLIVFDRNYTIDLQNPVFMKPNSIFFHQFRISRDDMHISLDGDLSHFDVSFKNVDLTPLNFLLSADTTIINKGLINGNVSYAHNEQLNLLIDIDSLSLYNSNPLTIDAKASGDDHEVPFEFALKNESNRIDLTGNYFPDHQAVTANLQVDVNNLELVDFLVSGFIEDLKGTMKGAATIDGPIQKPTIDGHMRFIDMRATMVNPKLTFNIEDDSISLKNSSLLFNHFTFYDREHKPLTVNGKIMMTDYQSVAYDLQLNSDAYTLINNTDSTSGKIRGLLVIGSDIKLMGDGKDTNINAKLTVKNATDLTVVTSTDDIELLRAEGIVDFIDPSLLRDSIALDVSTNFYDSLIASLPDFKLNSTVAIEDQAILKIIIDEQSGDYIEAAGGATLDMSYDRTGNLQLAGNYTIRKGVYRLSFYDLVKKNFNLVQGSSINWHGNAKNGDLSIKATHTVESNSIGLIGHEIGENEKSIYKRSLNYEVGINITGTIEKPIISFSLDLPPNEKVNYPVLANKLDRLRQPEYESELNKQVFGLLVLGGFLPETSGDINSNVIATTALSNSVNSLLASQLNRFASQYIKGVNIDVGIQSFSDYSAPGGKTQTAMDFRVSKSIMNDRLSFEIGGDFDINQDQSGANTGTKNYRGDIAIIYDLTGNGDKQMKLFNNETYDIIYQEIRNTGISLIFIREFERKAKNKKEKNTK